MWVSVQVLVVSLSINIPEVSRIRFKVRGVNNLAIVFLRLPRYYLLNDAPITCKIGQTAVNTHSCSTH
jgi:hypothetical protein